MLIFIGLGNIGDRYVDTRHNAGFMWIDKAFSFLINKGYNYCDFKLDKKFKAEVALVYDVKLNFSQLPNEFRDMQGSSTDILLAKPTTFMNLSGLSASKLVNFYKIDVYHELILVHDDLDLALGSFKIQSRKSPKGHNGVLSVQNSLGTNNFLKIRLGVDSRRPDDRIDPANYVLKKMTEIEKLKLNEAIQATLKLIFA